LQKLLRLLSTMDNMSTLDDRQNSVLASLVAEADRLSADIARDRAQVGQLQEKRQHHERRMAEMESKVQSFGGDLQRQREELERYCQRCQDFLGLDIITTTRDTTVFQFQLLDLENPEKKFSCELRSSHQEGEKPYEGELRYLIVFVQNSSSFNSPP
jgi:chromosome segregation ATPase